MFCRHCGSQIEETEAIFCPSCGERLNTVVPPDEPLAPPAAKHSKKKTSVLMMIIIAVILLLAAVAVFVIRPLLGDNDSDRDHSQIEATTTATQATTSVALTSVTATNTTTTIISTTTTKTTTTRVTTATRPTEPAYPPASATSVSSVVATSYLNESDLGFIHIPERIADNDLTTAWVEGAPGNGINESITLYLREPSLINGFTIHAGYQKASDRYTRNARPKIIRITFSDSSYLDCELEDIFAPQTIKFQPVVSSSLTVTILSVYEGDVFEDTAISEISLF